MKGKDDMLMIPCPCCGYYTISMDETQDIIIDFCEVCGWQYDVAGILKPDRAIGPNRISLNEARENYWLYQATEKRLVGTKWIRDPLPEELLENNL